MGYLLTGNRTRVDSAARFRFLECYRRLLCFQPFGSVPALQRALLGGMARRADVEGSVEFSDWLSKGSPMPRSATRWWSVREPWAFTCATSANGLVWPTGPLPSGLIVAPTRPWLSVCRSRAGRVTRLCRQVDLRDPDHPAHVGRSRHPGDVTGTMVEKRGLSVHAPS